MRRDLYTIKIMILLLILMLMCLPGLQAQNHTNMTFTTLKGQGATKDWSADTCFATHGENGKITITGRFFTGRTDLPTQDMVLVFSEFSLADTGRYAYVTDAYYQEIYTTGGKARYINTKIVGTTVTSSITGFDGDKYVLEGTFAFHMTSYPPTGEPFITQVYNGSFSAEVDNGLLLEVSPVNEVRINSDKKVNYKLYVKNSLGFIQPDASVFVTDELAKLAHQKVGYTNSAGEYVYTAEIPKSAESKKYKLKFEVEAITGTKKLSSEAVERIINVSGRYWVYSCLGVPLITFDAGEGKEWKSDDPLPTISATGKILINDILTCDGTVTIDPREGIEKMTGKYNMYIDGIDIAGTKQQLVIANAIGMSMNCNNLLKWDTPGIIKKKIGGYEFTLDELSFKDLNYAKAVKLKGSVQWANLYPDNCTINSNQPEFKSVTVGLTIAYEELAGFRIEAMEGSATNLSTAALPGFCIDNVAFSYDPVKDAFTLSTAVEASEDNPAKPGKKLFEGKAKMSLTAQNGRFEAGMIEGKVKPGMIIPDLPIFTWNGLKIETSGWSSLTTWKGVKASFSGFFNSVDDVLKQRVPWVQKICPYDDAVCEVEIGGKIEFAGPKITGFATARLLAMKQISVTKKWQVELSTQAILDIGNYSFEFGQVDLRAFHFGLDDYFIKTNNSPMLRLKLDPNDLAMVGTGMNVTLRLPDLPSDPPNKPYWGAMFEVVKWLKASKFLPRTLGVGAASISLSSKDGAVISGMVDVTTCGIPLVSTYGSLSFKCGLSSEGPFMSFGGAFKGLVSGKTEKLAKGGKIQEGEILSEFVQAQPLHAFEITENEKRAFLMIKSPTKVPVSALINPSGEKIAATKQDSSIILFQSEDGTFAQWALVGPAMGKWKLELTNPTQSDSVYVFSLNKDRDFAISAVESGKQVIVTWDKSNYETGDYVDIFIDSKNSGYSGWYQGRANAADGSFIINLTDSLNLCSFYVYANRNAAGSAPVNVYADGQFSFAKSSIPAPTKITLLSDQYGNCQLSYITQSNSSIIKYGIFVQSSVGTDSLIAIAYPEETILTFSCDTTLLSDLFLVPFKDDGNRGCPIKPESVIVGIQESEALAGIPSNLDLSIVPNPASDLVELRIMLPVDSDLSIGIHDLLGNKVADFPYTNYSAGYTRIIFNTAGLNQGTFVVRMMAGDNVISKTLLIVR